MQPAVSVLVGYLLMMKIESDSPRPSIFLFCNHGFGLPFTLGILWRTRRRADVTLVYSKRLIPRPMGTFVRFHWRQLRFFVIRTVVNFLARLADARVLNVTDVNARQFLSIVPVHCHGIVAGFGQIFSHPAIETFQSLVNFHPSVLPLYRGAIPSYWVLKNHEKRSGYTLHRIVERIDAGEVLYQGVVDCSRIKSVSGLNRKIAFASIGTLDSYLRHILDDAAWTSVTLNAREIYRVWLDYGRRPEESWTAAARTGLVTMGKP